MGKRSVRNALGAAGAAALMLPSAVPAQAAEVEAAPCQFLMPISVGDVTGCVCYRAYQIVILTTGEEIYCAAS